LLPVENNKIQQAIHLNTDNYRNIFMEILILILLILLNGFFALSEIALVSAKKSRLEQLKQEGNNGARIALKLREKSEQFLSSVQVGMTLIGIITGVYSGMSIADKVTPVFMNWEFTQPYAAQIALVLTVIVITFFSIVIGELVPKTVALSNSERIAVKIAPLIYFFAKLFYPFVSLLSVSTRFINTLLKIKKASSQITETELKHMIRLASLEGVIEQEQKQIHEKVFYFSDKKAKHIMTHRTEVEWIDVEWPIEQIKKEIDEAKHSKIVCCKGGSDNFSGLIKVKDYLLALQQGNIDINKLLIQPLVVPENADAQKVLDLFRQKHSYFAIVVNEYGGFEGIITLHDIMESILGEIPDEGIFEEPDIFIREDKSVLVNGDAPVEILTEIIEGFTIDFETVDYATVAGFVFEKLDKMPQIGDKFVFSGYIIEIVDLDGPRIDKVLVYKANSEMSN
jgi:putative hemolysin